MDREQTGSESARGQGHKTLAEAAFDAARRLAGDPNIWGVGYGVKLTGGLPARGGSLLFMVREKLRSAADIAARGSWAVPASVGDFATDVVEVGQLAPASSDRSPPTGARGTRIGAPLRGGMATLALRTQVSGPGGYGTLGGLAFDAAANTPLLLSNAHVWGQTVGTEVTQPVTPASFLGAAASPATVGSPPFMVQTRLPSGLTAPVAFANALAHASLIAGSDDDPLLFGQAATTVPAATRTDSEQVTIAAPAMGLPPAGKRLSPVLSWAYRRLSSAAVAQASSSAAHTPTKLLAARRLFSNAASYSAGQTVSLYAELIPASGGGPHLASAHVALVLLYPTPGGGRFVPRLLRPAPRQTPALVTTQFTGFPAPARLGPVDLPFVVAGAFTVDSHGAGTFQAATAGTLPAGTLALQLPVGSVRLFVPPSTRVVLDIDLRSFTGTLGAQGVNSAGDNTGTTSIPAPGPSGRTLVTIDASEMVEVRLTIAGTAVLYGVRSERGSPESTPPLSYAGSVSASELLPKGKWGASLFVQAAGSGFPESANVVETAIGAATLIRDCTFDVT